MKRECRAYWEGLVELAHGGDEPAAQTHCEACTECRARLAEMKEMRRLMALPSFAPPKDVLLRAQAIFPPAQRLTFRLISSSLAGARSVAEAFQCVYEIEGIRIRLMVAAEGSRWRVMGRVEGDGLELEIEDEPIVIDADGRFEAIVNRSDPEFWISGMRILPHRRPHSSIWSSITASKPATMF